MEVTQGIHHGRTGHIGLLAHCARAIDGTVSGLTHVISAPSIEQAVSIYRHGEVHAGHNLDNLGLLIGNNHVGRIQCHSLAVLTQIQLDKAAVLTQLHSIKATVLQNDHTALTIGIAFHLTAVEGHLLRLGLKAAHTGGAKTQYAIVVTAPGINIAVGLQGQDKVFA